MSKKYKNVCMALSYIEQLIILASAVAGHFSVLLLLL